MDHDDVGYSSVEWDNPYSPRGGDHHFPSEEDDDQHDNPYQVNPYQTSNILQTSRFAAASDDEDDNDENTNNTIVTSSAILPTEPSAWADESLDNEVIDINGAGVHTVNSVQTPLHTPLHTVTSTHNDSSSSSNMYSQDNEDGSENVNIGQSSTSQKARDPLTAKRNNESPLHDKALAKPLEVMLTNMFPMEITVTDPIKEDDNFISYMVNTKTTMPSFSGTSVSVRRRFQDFRWLHNALSRVSPERVLPPLPDKHRLGYVRGDRFSRDFVEKRRASLERYLNKIAAHPILQDQDPVRVFLDSRDWGSEQAQQARLLPDESRLEAVGDVFLNAFAKVKKPEEKFLIIKDEVDKLEENLQQLEKIGNRILKRQEELEADYREFGGAITSLGNLETGITGPLHRFGHTVSNYASILRDLTTKEDSEFLSELHECLAYCNSVKSVLKLRDQKQLDFEGLSEMYQQQVSERERLKSNGRLGGSARFGGFIQQKLDELKGVDQMEKLRVVEDAIKNLADETNKGMDISMAFTVEAGKEYELFQIQKTKDLRQCLLDYSTSRVEFFEKGEELWSQIIPDLEAIQVDE
ncbi:intercellular trafficking and secretion [Modicella reniformis]|uniref:Sorting nexin-4 n=1 Tax=Modicella reniformis TaxID=1440133 RepID=A0A9P6JH85_9FUNG|nr:intercellular trafficking and secretion [Modicella reniformis]